MTGLDHRVQAAKTSVLILRAACNMPTSIQDIALRVYFHTLIVYCPP